MNQCAAIMTQSGLIMISPFSVEADVHVVNCEL